MVEQWTRPSPTVGGLLVFVAFKIINDLPLNHNIHNMLMPTEDGVRLTWSLIHWTANTNQSDKMHTSSWRTTAQQNTVRLTKDVAVDHIYRYLDRETITPSQKQENGSSNTIYENVYETKTLWVDLLSQVRSLCQFGHICQERKPKNIIIRYWQDPRSRLCGQYSVNWTLLSSRG